MIVAHGAIFVHWPAVGAAVLAVVAILGVILTRATGLITVINFLKQLKQGHKATADTKQIQAWWSDQYAAIRTHGSGARIPKPVWGPGDDVERMERLWRQFELEREAYLEAKYSRGRR